MAVDTTTIRVARRTRDVLAEQAQEEGVSLASLLARFARERETASIWRSERAASCADAENAAVEDEDREWEDTLADGLG